MHYKKKKIIRNRKVPTSILLENKFKDFSDLLSFKAKAKL